MVHAEMKKRPSAQKLMQCSMFNSEHLLFIESIGELSLKAPREFLEVISKMEPKVAGLSRAVCAHKILPNLARTLQIAVNDFPLRDAREGCRQVRLFTIACASLFISFFDILFFHAASERSQFKCPSTCCRNWRP